MSDENLATKPRKASLTTKVIRGLLLIVEGGNPEEMKKSERNDIVIAKAWLEDQKTRRKL